MVSAVSELSIIPTLVFMIGDIVLFYFSGISIISLNKYISLICAYTVSAILIHFYFYGKGKRYKKVLQKYEHFKKEQREKLVLITALVYIFFFGLFMILLLTVEGYKELI